MFPLERRFEDAGKPSGKFGECLAAVFEAQHDGAFIDLTGTIDFKISSAPALTARNAPPSVTAADFRPLTLRFRPHRDLDFLPAMWYPSRRFCHKGLSALRKAV